MEIEGGDITLGTKRQDAEGSRGGKVIGHTKSGKPVYGSKHGAYASHGAFQQHYKGFTPTDHLNASLLHMPFGKKGERASLAHDIAADHPDRHNKLKKILGARTDAEGSRGGRIT